MADLDCYGLSDDESYSSDEDPSHCSTTSNEDVDLPFSEAERNNTQHRVVKSSWQVIDLENLEAAQSKALERVISILGCSTAMARRLLIHYGWDDEVLFGIYADRGLEWLLKDSSLTSRSDPAEGHPGQVTGATVYCASCLDDIPREQTTAMSCGHSFCNNCWHEYLRIGISEGKSRRLVCMLYRCGAVCDEEKVKERLQDSPELLERYTRSLLESYIEDNKRVRWCPSAPHCGRAIQVEGDPLCEPECACGVRMCFACGKEAHSPCSCDMWAGWVKKFQDDSETANWLTANTKPCPKCSKPVEKNGGCNLVVCVCGQAFCWLCGAGTKRAHTWTQIYGHECGRWKDDMERDIDAAQRQLKRYTHYHTRWSAHMDSLAMEKRQGQWFGKVKDKLQAMEEKDDKLKDYSWLHQALEQLLEARRVLGYSYVFAFYMFSDMFEEHISKEQNTINQNLFEDQQQMLEQEVERLSGMVQNLDDCAEKDMRLNVINSSVNVESRSSKLYELIENDLLGPLDMPAATIAHYRGTGACKQAALPEEEETGGSSDPEMATPSGPPPNDKPVAAASAMQICGQSGSSDDSTRSKRHMNHGLSSLEGSEMKRSKSTGKMQQT